MYYHGPHKLWFITGGPQITIDFILKIYFDLILRRVEASGLLSKCLLIMDGASC